jgi:hypothetical protein
MRRQTMLVKEQEEKFGELKETLAKLRRYL